ncbi:MAG TPA: anhydro-N-acetylmuramic acid kinase [Candidatus Rifleibacterium sp.]|nr:anhydro-N-acetylmuramic acid kinase [Candidatus Rifleibacterium sp.]
MLTEKLAKAAGKPVKILGMMSGTSGDGIDGCLVEFDAAGEARLVWLKSYDYSAAQFARIQKLMRESDAVSVTLGASYIAELHALACQQFFADETPLPDFIAAHGQTVWHQPTPITWEDLPLTGTLQLLNGALLAARTALPVICNFRAADMAAGGQGAPLVPFADLFLFGRPAARDRVVVNIGGMANLTAISSSAPRPEVICAFDTGPGNVLMDLYMQRSGLGRFDADGCLAATGKTLRPLLDAFLADPYFKLPPPKSTGREYFNQQRLDCLIEQADTATAADLMSTLLDITVESIAAAIRQPAYPLSLPAEVLVAGGGARNSELIRRLAASLRGVAEVTTTERLGVPIMAREAMAFAILGYAFLQGRPANVTRATGAKRPAVLGEFHPVPFTW